MVMSILMRTSFVGEPCVRGDGVWDTIGFVRSIPCRARFQLACSYLSVFIPYPYQLGRLSAYRSTELSPTSTYLRT